MAKKRLGLRSGVTRHFNFDPSKRLTDPVQLFYNGQLVYKTVSNWVEIAPELLYEAVYKKGAVSLASDSFKKLMEKLSETHPHLIEEIKKKKNQKKINWKANQTKKSSGNPS